MMSKIGKRDHVGAHKDASDPVDLSLARERGRRRTAVPRDSLKILQITDTHLYSDNTGRLLGVDTLDSFRAVIQAFVDTGWQPDLVLATGDLVHDATPTGYRQLAKILDSFGVPVYCLPGNHDDPDTMREHLRGKRVSCPRVVESKGWRVILMDSVVPGKVGGCLGKPELQQLRETLEASRLPTLISLHHQPVAVGSAWLDEMGLDDADALFDTIAGHPEVKGLLWGHVHQQFDDQRNGLRLMGTPSTCVQFEPASKDFAVDQRQPGFRLLTLTPDGKILSEVMRIDEMPAGLEVASGGYE